MMKRLIGITAVAVLVLSAGCSKNECEEGVWPEGYTLYDVSGSNEEANCVAPLTTGWDYTNPSSTEPEEEIKLTPIQGTIDILLRNWDGPVEPGTYRMGENAGNREGHELEIVMNIQHDINGDAYYNTIESCVFELEAREGNVLTGTVNFEYLDYVKLNSPLLKVYQVELDDVQFNINPR